MTNLSGRLLIGCPRILGILAALYLGIFALDAIDEGIMAFLLHLVPTFVLLLIVVLSWRRPWIGGILFIVLSVLYSVPAWARGVWNWGIFVPLLVIGLLYLWSWNYNRRSQVKEGSPRTV